jgi:hypothetical protein
MIFGGIAGLAIGLAIGTFIGAVILRAAVSLYNKLAGGAGSPNAVAEPSMDKAALTVFLATLANVVVGFLLGMAIGAASGAAGARGEEAAVIAQVAALPVGVLVMAGILSAMLRTTFWRAILVTLCYMLVSALIVGVIVVFVLVALR